MIDEAERVRQVLGIDDSYLKDDEVMYPEFMPQAELIIKGLYPTLFDESATLPLEIESAKESAIVYKTALLLLPSLPRRFPKRQKGEHAEFEIDTKSIKADLEDNLKDIFKIFDDFIIDSDEPCLPIFRVTGRNCKKCGW